MSRNQIERSRELLVQTNAVLEALRADLPPEEMDLLLERQRDAFSDFSRYGDTEFPLDNVSQNNIDAVLRLEELIVDQLRHLGDELIQKSRSLTRRRDLAQAFNSKIKDPPRFIARHV
ncbi:MAG: hypothetical protein IH881_01075 [Myxococcales bacterium]|nr:hypothetical protein [Myxococcales bacterium]